jgi:hypothetical protein
VDDGDVTLVIAPGDAALELEATLARFSCAGEAIASQHAERLAAKLEEQLGEPTALTEAFERQALTGLMQQLLRRQATAGASLLLAPARHAPPLAFSRPLAPRRRCACNGRPRARRVVRRSASGRGDPAPDEPAQGRHPPDDLALVSPAVLA